MIRCTMLHEDHTIELLHEKVGEVQTSGSIVQQSGKTDILCYTNARNVTERWLILALVNRSFSSRLNLFRDTSEIRPEKMYTDDVAWLAGFLSFFYRDPYRVSDWLLLARESSKPTNQSDTSHYIISMKNVRVESRTYLK